MKYSRLWKCGLGNVIYDADCRSTGVFKVGKFEKETLLQFPQMKCISMIFTLNCSESYKGPFIFYGVGGAGGIWRSVI